MGTIAIDGYSGTTMYLRYTPDDDADSTTLYLIRHDTGASSTTAIVSGQNSVTVVEGVFYMLVAAEYDATPDLLGFTNFLFRRASTSAEGDDFTVQWISDYDTDWLDVGLDIDEVRSRIPTNRRGHYLQWEIKTHAQNQRLVLRNASLTVRLHGRAYAARQQ